MGSSLCKPKKKKVLGGTSWVGDETENPFENAFSKKERVCLRETYQRLHDPRELVGLIFVDIIYDVLPELKKVFGVDRVPKANMLKMPKLGGHVSRFTDLLDQLTSLVGYTENLLGAWQLVRKTGRLHTHQAYLDENQTQPPDSRNYFEVVTGIFTERFIPYLTGELEEPAPEGQERRKVRFATVYTPQQISEVWKRFFQVLCTQLTEAFELERTKQRNAQNQKTLAPHQHVEQTERKKKKIAERQSEIENSSSSHKPQEQEQMFEDPF